MRQPWSIQRARGLAGRAGWGIFAVIFGLRLSVARAEPTHPQTIREPEVLAAMETMFRDPLSEAARQAQATVIEFAKTSNQVSVEISPRLFLFTNSRYDSLLMAHYIAGAVEFDLAHRDQARDRMADAPAALSAAVAVYRKMRLAKVAYYNPFFETVDAWEQRGKLGELIRKLVREPHDAQ